MKENYLEKNKKQGWHFQFLNGMKYGFITAYINVLLCIFIFMQDDVTLLSRRVKFDLTDSRITEIYQCKVSVGK